MMLARVFSLISLGCLFSLSAGVSLAQDPPAEAEAQPTSEEVIARFGIPSESVAAVVNDKVITTYDVRQRMRLMIISAGGRIPVEALPQIQEQALTDLVEEKLKLQEATKFEIVIPDEEINQELTLIAAEQGLSLEDFTAVLAAQGVAINSIRDQISTNIFWPDIVRGRFRDRVRVSDDEVDSTLERMKDDASTEQFQVSEICIPVDDPAQAQQFYQGALQLIEQMRRGVPFTVVAQQFSACTTAAVGGDLGWVRAGQLDPAIDNAIRNLAPGSVSNPIPSEGAFMIMAVRDRREAVIAGEPTFKLGYASAPESVGENTARFAFEKLAESDLCSGRELRTDLGENIGYALLENMTLDTIEPQFREWIEDLNRGESSPVIRAGGAFHAAYVCDKDDGLGLPSREALENQIFAQQLSRISQQYLRDLERKSSVDIRLKDVLEING